METNQIHIFMQLGFLRCESHIAKNSRHVLTPDFYPHFAIKAQAYSSFPKEQSCSLNQIVFLRPFQAFQILFLLFIFR